MAMYDYAFHNETILGNKSIILYDMMDLHSNKKVIDKFEQRFEVYGVTAFEQVDNILQQTKCDMLYIIKFGNNDGKVSKVIKTVVHCVFKSCEPHGQVYASIAQWIDGNKGCFPVVPHMINLPDGDGNLRSQLNIPIDAIVYGRHGGYDQFDIKYVHPIVYNVALQNSNIYFLFVNTQVFCNKLPNIIHLPTIVDLTHKVKFINTCDAMLWARSDGEIFSLSMGEFSVRNKPIICTHNGTDGNGTDGNGGISYFGHVHLLKEQAIWYNKDTLTDILTNFNKLEIEKQDWNVYREYTPQHVMSIFKQVFIDKKIE